VQVLVNTGKSFSEKTMCKMKMKMTKGTKNQQPNFEDSKGSFCTMHLCAHWVWHKECKFGRIHVLSTNKGGHNLLVKLNVNNKHGHSVFAISFGEIGPIPRSLAVLWRRREKEVCDYHFL